MSSTAGFGGAGATGAGSLARSTPQVYHDAVLASQQPDGRDTGTGSGPLPPLVPPPIDPSLGAFAPGTGPVRQGAENAPSSAGAPAQHLQGPPQHLPQGNPQAPQTQQARPAPPQQQQPSHDPQVPQQAGFPMARVFDGVKPDGGPLINRQNLDPRELPALQAYLTRAAVVLSAPGTTRDELVPGALPNVPRAFHSDGTWIWPAAVGYYLSLYQLPPQPELLAHIRSRQYTLVPVHPQAVQAAAAQIVATLNARQARPPAPSHVPPQTPMHVPPQAHLAQGSVGGPAVHADPVVPVASAPPEAVNLIEFSAGFNAVGNRHAAWVTEQLETFLAYLPLGEWSVDHATRTYRQSGREFAVDALGTLSPAGVWTWAWADPVSWGQNSAITEQARRLRALGEREGIAEFVTAAFGLVGIADAPDSPQDAAEMLAWTAMGMLGARGYIGHSGPDGEGGARVYYVVCDPSVPSAVPRLGTVPRFVMEGAATFGEDAAECVLGYVEHYGWEWSRVPGGIVVAAEGIGSFTVEFAADGQLTGLSLHR